MIPNINIDDVLASLGYKNQIITVELKKTIYNNMSECISHSNPKYCYKVVPIEHITETEIRIANSNLVLKGNHITSHLRNVSKVALFAATLGVSFDNYLRFSQIKSLSNTLILDICANQYIESFCDIIEKIIKKDEHLEEFYFLPRFSPGYGDFDLSIQSEILNLLDAQRKIGLTCTENHIMIPRKSVTAIVGITNKDSLSNNPNDKACDICQFNKNCELQKGGFFCGHKKISKK